MSQNTKTIIISDSEGARFDRWIKRLYPSLTQGILEKLLRTGKILLDGKKIKSSTRITLGQSVAILEDLRLLESSPKKQTSDLTFTPEDQHFIESLILWEDDDILVLNKPHGLAVQGGSNTKRHLDGLLQGYAKITHTRYRLVHRLDRDTSGVFVVAKTLEASTHLATCFKEGKTTKVYWAIVNGTIPEQKGSIEAPLLKSTEGHLEKVVVDKKQGKKAKTNFRIIKRFSVKNQSYTLVELTPQTGRTHQLRVHALHIGTPIVGDGKYGGKMATYLSRDLHLHARKLSFPDRQGSTLTFVAPLPHHMDKTLQLAKIDWNKYV